MAQVGTEAQPLRVAIVGAGAAGFYTAAHFLKRQPELHISIDIYDRLPTPFGLVRSGVAPDHQKDKSVTALYDRIAANPAVNFYGNVEYGLQINLEQMQAWYHQIVFTTGACLDRNLNISNEKLQGSHAATEFVGWYNSHPDFTDQSFNLSGKTAVIIGVGNVAVDVARMLAKSPENLASTDISDEALEALRHSKLQDIYLIGRRGPAQAAFTHDELKALTELEDVSLVTTDDEITLDALSIADLEQNKNKNAERNMAILHGLSQNQDKRATKRLHLRFWWSPEALEGDQGHITHVRLRKNKAVQRGGRVAAAADEQVMRIETGLVFRSVGYQGTLLPDLPFDEKKSVVANEQGRVIKNGQPVTGLYVAGWIKRGATGVIGSNKVCARETVQAMLADKQAGLHLLPTHDQALGQLLEKQHQYVTYDEWLKIDAVEKSAGEKQGRPRVKFSKVADMLAVAKGG